MLPFQSTCPRGARPTQKIGKCRILHFNPRAHEGHDVCRGRVWCLLRYFNPRAHEGHDIGDVRRKGYSDFNPRAHEGHDVLRLMGLIRVGNFNPRAHEGHDQHPARIDVVIRISIHVPTRGTTIIAGMIFGAGEFQSTCPRGARHVQLSELADTVISIHVPTRGTTHRSIACQIMATFQSTCPRGARPGGDLLGSSGGFQSTCPRGARPSTEYPCSTSAISIHVPTRGTTDIQNDHNKPPEISIHVPTRGTTHGILDICRTLGFQSTCPRGARLITWRVLACLFIFQSTCPRGARQCFGRCSADR